MMWPLQPLSKLSLLAVDCVNKTAPIVDRITPFKMIRTTNVKGGFIDTKAVRYVSENTFIKWTQRVQPKYGDVVLTREAPVGEVGRCTFDETEQIFLGQRLFLYRPNPKLLDWNYLAYVLQSPIIQNKLNGMSFGATVPHIKVGDAENLEIPYPSLTTQKKIGQILANYDDLIEINIKRIALLEKFARLLYQEWFVKLHLSQVNSTSKNNNIPHGWKYHNLYDVADIAMGYPFKAKYFNKNKEGKVAIRIRDIPDVTPSTWTTEEPSSSAYQVTRGDFLIGMDGIFHMNHWASSPAWLVQRVCRIRPKNEIHKAYLALALYEPIKYFESTISGATVAHLGAKHLQSINILIPNQKETERLMALNTLLEQKLTLIEQNFLLIQARDELLPKLISGQIKV